MRDFGKEFESPFLSLQACLWRTTWAVVKLPIPLRKPCLLQPGFLSQPTTLISERVRCTDTVAGHKLEFRYAKEATHPKDFPDFVGTTPKDEVIGFFRDIVRELEVHRGLRDYHFKVRPELLPEAGHTRHSFRVEARFGDHHDMDEPHFPLPDDLHHCMACYPEASLFAGMSLSGDPPTCVRTAECEMEEFSDPPRVACRWDHKGRSGFRIVPIRHVETMSALNDEELFSLWNSAVKVLVHFEAPFISLILNHGSYRSSLKHLQLKVWIENHFHEQGRLMWSDERKEQWNRMQEIAITRPKKQKLCYYFKKHKSCRNGDFCSFRHNA